MHDQKNNACCLEYGKSIIFEIFFNGLNFFYKKEDQFQRNRTFQMAYQKSACCVWHFTYYAEEFSPVTVELMALHLGIWCKKWVFQLEKGEENGRLHYQGMFSLNIKERIDTLCKKDFFELCHLSCSSTANQFNFSYVMKEDTRVEGPWRDDEYIKIPRDVKEVERLRPWQQSLLEMIKVYQQRKVYVIYDPAGNSGKSTFTRWCMCYKQARKIPFANDFKDLLRMVCDMPVAKAYIFDMPRAINKEKLFQFYAGVEEIKSGYAYDDRYKFKEIIFDPPNIVIFTNALPDESLLSRDRWSIFSIIDNKLEVFKALRCNNEKLLNIDFKFLEQMELNMEDSSGDT